MQVIEDKPKTQLTLITWHANGVTRFLTVADFVEKVPVKEASSEILESLDLELNKQSQ